MEGLGGGYTLNTVSESEANQVSTNTQQLGGIHFGDTVKGGFSTKQLIAIGVAVVIVTFLVVRK